MTSRPTQGRGEFSAAMRMASGRQLRQWREAAGKTQQEIAKEIGFAYYTMISQLELGRSFVPPERYREYAAALGVDLESFVRWQVRWSNPYAWAILFGGPDAEKILRDAPERLADG